MYVLFCAKFPKVRSHGFVNAYMMGRLIIQMNCSLIVLSNGRTCANVSELLSAYLSARCKNRLHSRNSVFVIIADTTGLWQLPCLSLYISCLDSLAHPLKKRIVRKALSVSHCHGKHMVTFQTGVISWLDACSYYFSIFQENFI